MSGTKKQVRKTKLATPKSTRIKAMIQRSLAQLREMAARERERGVQQKERARESLKFSHILSGEILPDCKYVPLGDLAARWKVSPAMLRLSAENGLFDVLVIECDGFRDHWYLNPARWPHGEEKSTVVKRGIVHTLVSVPQRLTSFVDIFLPIEEVKRIEAQGNVKEMDFLDPKEACKIVGVDPRTLRNWVAAKKLTRYSSPSGKPLYRKSDLVMLSKKEQKK